MNNVHPSPFSRSHGAHPVPVTPAETSHPDQVKRVLRNTYALLAMTLLFSAGVAVATLTLQLPAPGLILTLVGYFGLLYMVHKLQNSAWALPAVFALTGFMGYTLGPLLTHSLALPGGAQTVTLGLAATGLTFLALSSFVLLSRRDFSFMGGFIMVGVLVAFLAGIGALIFNIPALSLAVSAMFILLMSGFILYQTSEMVHGGETNYIMATVTLFVSIYNLFTSLLHLLGVFGGDEG